MRTYLFQYVCKNLTVTIFLSLMLTIVVIADSQSPHDPCTSQTAISVMPQTERGDSVEAVTSISNSSRNQLSDKELMEKYRSSIEGKIIGITTDMMVVFTMVAMLCMMVITFLKI